MTFGVRIADQPILCVAGSEVVDFLAYREIKAMFREHYPELYGEGDE